MLWGTGKKNFWFDLWSTGLNRWDLCYWPFKQQGDETKGGWETRTLSGLHSIRQNSSYYTKHETRKGDQHDPGSHSSKSLNVLRRGGCIYLIEIMTSRRKSLIIKVISEFSIMGKGSRDSTLRKIGEKLDPNCMKSYQIIGVYEGRCCRISF